MVFKVSPVALHQYPGVQAKQSVIVAPPVTLRKCKRGQSVGPAPSRQYVPSGQGLGIGLPETGKLFHVTL